MPAAFSVSRWPTKKTVFVVQQQFVELGDDRFADTEPVRDAGQYRIEHARPMSAPDADPLPAYLPGAPYRCVDDRRFAAAIGCGFGHGDKAFGLRRQQWQRHRPDTVDLQQRRQHLGRAGGEEAAGPANRAQSRGKIGGDG
ncbi:MAG: hypothetical protein M3Y41_01670 [Pseudomonadota bacterium]|nr:hypothetical protein [Pseudomonadota bacterium]